MIVVKIKSWPHGDEKKSRLLGVIVTNDKTGDIEYNWSAVDRIQSEDRSHRRGMIVPYIIKQKVPDKA